MASQPRELHNTRSVDPAPRLRLLICGFAGFQIHFYYAITVETQSEPSLSEHRAAREADRPRSEDRRPYAHAESPFRRPEPEAPKPRGGFQRRIDQLTREKADLQRQLSRQQSSGDEQTQPTAPQQPESQPGAQPKRESLRELAERLEREVSPLKAGEQPQPSSQQLTPEQQQQEFQQNHTYKRQAFQARVTEMSKADPELSELMKGSSKMLMPLAANIAIVEQQNGAELRHFPVDEHWISRKVTRRLQRFGYGHRGNHVSSSERVGEGESHVREA